MWRALVHPDMLAGSSLTRRLVVVAEDLRSLDRPIPQAELAARTGCHRATPGRLAVRDLGGIIERDRPGAGHPWTWIPDPDLSADDCRRPVGYVPLAAVDATYAELLGLEPSTDIEATTAMARSIGARYNGRLRPGATIGGLAHDAGLSRRAYRAAEGRLVEKGYLTRTGPKGVWNGRLAHPDGVVGAVLRQHWGYRRKWTRDNGFRRVTDTAVVAWEWLAGAPTPRTTRRMGSADATRASTASLRPASGSSNPNS